MDPFRFVAIATLTVPSLLAAEVTLDGRKFTLPEGFTVERVVTTNLVQRPVSASFDEQGRLYVTDSSGSNEPPSEQLKDPGARVVRLEDTDGDGVFDRSVVFADKVMFPQGCLWHAGSVYVAGPPSIWKFTDTDGDGAADRREEWFKGGTLTGCANDIHGPYLGPDGFIYWTKGAFAEQTHTLGSGRVLQDKAAHIYRALPDGSGLDVIMSGGMDNPVGVAFTPEGEPIFTSTFIDFSQPGFRDGIAHAVYGGVFGKANDVLDDGRVKRTGPDLMQPFVQLGAAAPSGLCRYESEVFGAGFRDNFFASSFNLHKVTRHVLRPHGSTYASTDSDFLASDDVDFHPTDVLEDADGSLLVVDTGGWYRLCCPSSQLAKPDVPGTIYRVRKTDAPKVADPWGLRLAWDEARMAQIATRLDDARPAVRARAVRALSSFGTNAVPLLESQVRSLSRETKRNALWALARQTNRIASAAMLSAFSDEDPPVRQTVAKAMSVFRDRYAFGPLAGQLLDEDPAVARVTAEAFGRVVIQGDHSLMLFNVTQRRAVIPDGLDAALEHAVIRALIEINDPKSTRLGFNHSRPQTRRAALIALDQMDAGDLFPIEVADRLFAPDARERAAAAWIIGRRANWGGMLTDWFRARLTDGKTTDERRQIVHEQFHTLPRSEQGQKFLAEMLVLTNYVPATRLAALQAMANAGLKEPPAFWNRIVLNLLAGASAAGDTNTLSAAVRTARSLGRDAGIQGALRSLSVEGRHPAPLRLEALAALPAGLPLAVPEFDFARSQLDPSLAPTLRTSAAEVLARAKLEPAQLAVLAGGLKSAGPLELNRLLAAFDAGGDDALGQKLVAALKESKSARALPPGQLQPHFTKFPDATRTAVAELLATLNAGMAKQAAHLDALLAELEKLGGDQRRGQAVFNGPKAACSACHRIGYVGGNVGPELTEIGKVRTERDLLEAIVYPSASFVRSYEPSVVALKGGEELSGVVRRDTAEEVVLVTGPGVEQRIPRAEVAEVRPGTISLMPGGLDEQLTRQELADLLRFVKDVRWR